MMASTSWGLGQRHVCGAGRTLFGHFAARECRYVFEVARQVESDAVSTLILKRIVLAPDRPPRASPVNRRRQQTRISCARQWRVWGRKSRSEREAE